MAPLKRNFFILGSVLAMGLVPLIAVNTGLAQHMPASSGTAAEMPVSINAIMVTLIDHSAHHIWDYSVMPREITDDEWRIVEYYAIQLAAAGPAITLGGTGPMDDDWVQSPLWTEYAHVMSSAGMQAMAAARNHNKVELLESANVLTDSCEGCHVYFKPELPSEGITHMPDYDLIYHVFGMPD